MIETLSHPAQSAEFLSRRHDGELDASEAAAFESHRRECAECTAAVEEFENALAAYRSAPVSPHAADLSARILRKIRAASPSRRPFGVMFGIDIRWAGALAATLLVVIIGAPVFSRRDHSTAVPPRPASAPANAPIPAYVLDSEEERPAEKRIAGERANANGSRVEDNKTAPKAAAPAPEQKADVADGLREVSGFAEAPPAAKQESADARRDEIASVAPDAAATRHKEAQLPAAAPAPAAPQAAAQPRAAEAPSTFAARRQSASAPVGGEAGAGAGAEGSGTPIVVKLTIQPADGGGEPPEIAETPSDDRLAVLRGRKFLLVLEPGGRVVAVDEQVAGRKLAKDKAREADDPGAARSRALAETLMRELIFQPGDRSRRIIVTVQ